MKTTLKTILGITMIVFIANCSRKDSLSPLESKPLSKDSIVLHPIDTIHCPWDSVIVLPFDSIIDIPVDSAFVFPHDSL
jgi:hypothetical protein